MTGLPEKEMYLKGKNGIDRLFEIKYLKINIIR
jgi:hypothetical protein